MRRALCAGAAATCCLGAGAATLACDHEDAKATMMFLLGKQVLRDAAAGSQARLEGLIDERTDIFKLYEDRGAETAAMSVSRVTTVESTSAVRTCRADVTFTGMRAFPWSVTYRIRGDNMEVVPERIANTREGFNLLMGYSNALLRALFAREIQERQQQRPTPR